ncbi:MAG: copper-binding protein [Planctomycetota bacterium]
MLLVCFSTFIGCGGESDADYEHVYTVRGRVLQLPDGTLGSDFRVFHEPIPDYVAISGAIGMEAMPMPFTVNDPTVLEGVQVGDVVEIVYGETHRPKVRQGVIAITILPRDTSLSFD